MISARRDVRAHEVPSYKAFVQHVWSYEDEECGRVIAPPPWVYSVLFDDCSETNVVLQNVRSTSEALGAEDRIKVVKGMSDNNGVSYDVGFSDLEALHLFLARLGVLSREDPLARQVGEFMLWTLGFRWV